MARGSLRGVTGLLITLLVVGCSGGAEVTTTSRATSTTTSTSTTTTRPTTTTTLPPTTSTTTPGVTTTIDPDLIDAEVSIPEGEGPFPAVVLVHGGGWVAGQPSIMRPLAGYLTDQGYLTVNTRYRLSTLDHPGFPEAVEDVACAVRFASSHPDSDGTVVVIGHSAGAHIGAIVALTGDEYHGDCPFPGSGVPERFVGLAGPYDIDRIGFAMAVFFGGTAEELPDAWAAGNPQLLTDANPSLDALIMYGELDGLVADSFAVDFWSALEESGADAVIELVEGARHNDMHDPAMVGDLIATWLDR